MKKTKILFIGLLTTLLVGTAIGLRHPISCIQLSGQRYQTQPNINFDPNMPENKRSELTATIEAAHTRIKKTFGDTTSNPIVFIAASADVAQTYGSNSFGATHRSILGQCVIIGPEGQNIDVIAHELMHAEIGHRLGFWKSLTALPVWFDEGLAMQVDHRQAYSATTSDLTPQTTETIKTAFYGYQFFNPETGAENYQAAKLAVHELFRDTNYKSIFRKLDRIKNGEGFSTVFQP